MRTTIVLTLVALAGGLHSALQLEPGGAPWQILTCHFTHWTYEQLAWDALAFLALGVACARRDRASFHATLLASAITVPLAVLAFAPEVTAYRGLSGLDSALFALLLALEARKSKVVVLFAIAFAVKIGIELSTGSAVFAGSGFAPVPIAHVAGAITALLVTTAYTRGSCVASSSCSSR